MRILAIMLALIPVLGHKSSPPKPPTPAEAEAVWHLTLPEAIRIGLENQEVVDCIWIGAVKIPLGDFAPAEGAALAGPRGE